MAKQPTVPDMGFNVDGLAGIATAPTFAGLSTDFLNALQNNAEVTIPPGQYSSEQIEYMEWQLAHNKNLKKLTINGDFDNANGLEQLIRNAGKSPNLNSIDLKHPPLTDGATQAIIDIANANKQFSQAHIADFNLNQLASIADQAPRFIESFKCNFAEVSASNFKDLNSLAKAMNGHSGRITIGKIKGELSDEQKITLRQYTVDKYTDDKDKYVIQGVDFTTTLEKHIKNAASAEDIVVAKNTIGGESLASDDAQKLAEALKGNANLHTVDIDGVVKTNDDLTKIINACDKENFTSLTVKSLGVQGTSATAIADLLKNRSIENLTLQNNMLQANELRIIAPALALKDKNLASVDLSNNSIGDEGVKILAENMTSKSGSPKGITIDLTRNNITDAAVDDIVALAKTLNTDTDPNRKASRINLAGNNFSKEALAQLASVKQYITGVDGIPDPASAPSPAASAPASQPATPPAAAAPPAVADKPVDGVQREREANAPQQTATAGQAGGGSGTQQQSGGTHKAAPHKPHHKDYHHQSVAHSEDNLASQNPDELAARAAESVKKYTGTDGQPLPGPVNVYGKIVGGDNTSAAPTTPGRPSGPGV